MKTNQVMNDFIRRAAGIVKPADQAPAPTVGNAGNGAAAPPPRGQIDMGDLIRLNSGRISEAAILRKTIKH